jgi:hypothetical protein
MTKTTEGAIVDWLEEIPVEELASKTSQRIVGDFRANLIDVTEAIAYLQEECADELLDYVNNNKKLMNLLDLSTINL